MALGSDVVFDRWGLKSIQCSSTPCSETSVARPEQLELMDLLWGFARPIHAALGAKLLWRETALIELADDKAIAVAQDAFADLADAANIICAEKGQLLNANRAPLDG